MLYDQDKLAGGMMRTQIPKFRLPESVLDEEYGNYILGLEPELRLGAAHRQPGKRSLAVRRLRRGVRQLRRAGAGAISKFPDATKQRANIHIGIDLACRASRSATSTKSASRVIVLGGGNTAMDCCRTSRRLGGEDVHVVVRSGFEER